MSTSGRSRLKDFVDKKEIGRGGFGVVYEATRVGSDGQKEKIALKKISSRVPHDRIRSEIRAIRSLKHSNIVKFYEDFVDDGDTYVVMELCQFGSLRDYVRKKGPLTEKSASQVLRQLISAVRYMHKEGVLHRDLSAGNILIYKIYSEEKLYVKLCDFGLATNLKKGETACTVVGTPGYIAPQVLEQRYDQAADVYSLGGVLFTMLTGSDPPRSTGRRNTNSLGDNAAELIDRMMDSDASKRIQLEDILQTAFIRSSDDLPMSREWSSDRKHILSHERRTLSRDFSRDRYTRERSKEIAGENTRTHRAASNPPPVRRPIKVTGGTRTDSGFASASAGEEPVYVARRSRSRPISNGGHTRENDYRNSDEKGLPWPIYFQRCGGAKLVSAGGRYVVVDDQKVVFEMVNKSGFISKIVVVTVSRDNHQQIRFEKPLRSDYSTPHYDDQLLSIDPNYKAHPITSLSFLNRLERDIYRQICHGIEELRGRVDKVVYIRPPQFPKATAKLMENGAFRVVFKDQRRMVQKLGTKGVQIIYPDPNGRCRKEDVNDYDTLSRFNELRDYLLRVEEVWGQHFGIFPISFSTSKETTQTYGPSLAGGDRQPLHAISLSQHQTNRATVTPLGPRNSYSCKPINDRSCTSDDCMKFKLNKYNEVCSVEAKDGRYLRVSSSEYQKENKVCYIYRSGNGVEERFKSTDAQYPVGARELYNYLQQEICRRC